MYLPIGSVSVSKFSAMSSFLIAFNKSPFWSIDFNELRFSSVIAKILLFSTLGVKVDTATTFPPLSSIKFLIELIVPPIAKTSSTIMYSLPCSIVPSK